MYLIMPALMLAPVATFELRRGLEIAFVLLALSPVPPILPTKEIKAAGNPSYVLSLLFVTAVLSIVFVPASVHLVGWVFGYALDMPMGPIAWIVTTSLLAFDAVALLVVVWGSGEAFVRIARLLLARMAAIAGRADRPQLLPRPRHTREGEFDREPPAGT